MVRRRMVVRKAAVSKRATVSAGSPLQSGGGGGRFDDMEARVTRLENDQRELLADVKAIRLDIAEIKGKLSNIPSTWQMIALMVSLLGLAFVVIKFT